MIKFVILDIDGVLTKGEITYLENGMEIKSFHVRDGMGIKLAQRLGIEFGVISGRDSYITKVRCDELKIKHVFQGVEDKLGVYNDLKILLGLQDEEVAYIGDDINDLPILKKVGFSATVADAPDYVKEHVEFITTEKGGEGAVREFLEEVIRRNGQWDDFLSIY